MAITKFYKIISPRSPNADITDMQDIGGSRGLYGNYTWYTRLVQGSSTRVQRLREYDIMDTDIDIARALDIISNEMTGNNPKTELPLELLITAGNEQRVASNVVVTLQAALKTWCKLQSWDTRIRQVVRNTIKYGDVFFYRSKKKNKKWIPVFTKNVLSAITSLDDVTDVRGWHIKTDVKNAHSNMGTAVGVNFSQNGNIYDQNVAVFNVDEIIRFTMNDDMSEEAPFGQSILRTIYRTFKQKELLEDSIIIYRIVRAPERRIFYIDTGKMPAHKVAQHLEQVKNEFRQKKIPQLQGAGGGNQVESIYNPQSIQEDIFLSTNSEGRGTKVETLPPGCLDLSTEIPLLDGRVLTLSQMIEEYKEGKQNWIYSVNPETGEPLPGIVSWAGITHESVEVYEILLDNGEKIICTPDHKFPIWGRGITETKDLQAGDSFIAFNEQSKPIRPERPSTYHQVYDHSTKKWVFTHRMVRKYQDAHGDTSVFQYDEQFKNEPINTVHHKDFNRYNNNPDNLTKMNGLDHRKYHSDLAIMYQPRATEAARLKYYNDEEYRQESLDHLASMRKKYHDLLETDASVRTKHAETTSKNMLAYYDGLLPEESEEMVKRCRINLKDGYKIAHEMFKNPGYREQVFGEAWKHRSIRQSEGGDLYEPTKERLNRIRVPCKNQEVKFNDELIQIVIDLIKDGHHRKDVIVEQLNANEHFMEMWRALNVPSDEEHPNLQYKIDTSSFRSHQLIMMVNGLGYANFEQFRDFYLLNHSISDEVLADRTEGMTQREAEFFKRIVDLTKAHLNAFTLTKVINENEELKAYFLDAMRNVTGMRTRAEEPTIKTNNFNRFANHFGYETFKQFTQEKDLFNHRVVSVTKLEGMRPVGTLTIDKYERWNPHHMFALKAGVYTKNSANFGSEELQWFYMKMWRGLMIPASYIGNTNNDSTTYNDGAVGLAYIQEIKFAQECERLQKHIETVMDIEFKKFLYDIKLNIDTTIFKLQLPAPTNWSKSKQNKIDNDLVNVYNAMKDDETMSKRFVKKKYLGLTQEEIILNQRLLAEELGMDPDKAEKNLPMLYAADRAEQAGFDGGMNGGGEGGGDFDEGGEGDEDSDTEDTGEAGEESGGSEGGESNQKSNGQSNNTNNKGK